MKKFVALLLVLVMALSLCACGVKTLEDTNGMYAESADGYLRVYFDFEGGEMTMEIYQYVDDPSSPSGKIANDIDTYTYEYTLNGENHIIVEGTDYYYRINKEAGTVSFSGEFLGLAKNFTLRVY